MRVLGHRVLIRPDAQPDHDGAILLPQDRDWVATSGTVVQIGAKGSAWRYDVRQRTLAEAITCLRDLSAEFTQQGASEIDRMTLNTGWRELVKRLGTTAPEQDLRVGDRVAFSADSGFALTIGGEPFLVLDYDSVLNIVQEAEEAA